MNSKKKARWLELVGGIFGWVWIASCVGAIYLLVKAIFDDGSWVNLVGAILIGGISKAVLRECETRKNLLMARESMDIDGNEKPDDSDEPAWTEEVEKIVHQYGEILQHASPAPGSVADQDKLPYPKEVIKTALITALRHNADSHQKDALEAAYLGLANWQPDVGDADQGFDLTNLDTMLEPSELLALHESSKHWEQIVQNEAASLYAELQDLDL